MLNILVVNGPNLNLLGQREIEIYGEQSLDELNDRLNDLAVELGATLTFYQSNSEGDIIDYLQQSGFEADGLIINPGAFTHYSYAIRDAIAAVGITAVEVHISNIYNREKFRKKSVIAPVCLGQLSGFGYYGYAMALSFLADQLREDSEE